MTHAYPLPSFQSLNLKEKQTLPPAIQDLPPTHTLYQLEKHAIKVIDVPFQGFKDYLDSLDVFLLVHQGNITLTSITSQIYSPWPPPQLIFFPFQEFTVYTKEIL